MYSVYNNITTNQFVSKLIDILLAFTPTESSPNGNFGYVQRNVREHIAILSPIGLEFDIIADGDVHTPTVWQVTAVKKNFTNGEIKALKAYVRKYITNSPKVFGDWYNIIGRACRTYPTAMKSIGFTADGGRITLPDGETLWVAETHIQRHRDHDGVYQDTIRKFTEACDAA